MLNRFLRLFGGSSPHNTVRPKPLLILGMHRSGTSCLAGMLRDAGVFMGEVSEANAYNRKGNLEGCLLYTSPSPRDGLLSRMPSSA